MTVEELQAYELIEKREIAELNSTGYYLKHRKQAQRSACFPMKTIIRCSISVSGRLRLMIQACRILWSIRCSAVPGSSR